MVREHVDLSTAKVNLDAANATIEEQARKLDVRTKLVEQCQGALSSLLSFSHTVLKLSGGLHPNVLLSKATRQFSEVKLALKMCQSSTGGVS